MFFFIFFFFFQAEDGIRDADVTGVQTCALPICKTLLPKLIELLELEAKVERMIIEIEKSKRRVNAIENIVLKELDEQMRVIKAKLSDIERSNTIRIMKSKELIIEKDKK